MIIQKCLFTPFLYKNLQVNPVKSAHEQELAISVLPVVETPSDAVEVCVKKGKHRKGKGEKGERVIRRLEY